MDTMIAGLMSTESKTRTQRFVRSIMVREDFFLFIFPDPLPQPEP